MTVHVLPVPDPVRSPALVRFVADGLLVAVQSHLRGELPLPRLARELRARTDVLAELGPPARTLTRLRWLHREVARLDDALRGAGGTGPDPSERARLEVVLESFRDTLAALKPPAPPLADTRVVPAAGAGWVVPAADGPPGAQPAGA